MRRHMPAALLAIVVIVSGGCTSDDTSIATDAPPPTSAVSGDAMAAEVERLIDGDSLVLSIAGQTEEVRLVGVNANEGDECFGPEAATALGDLITGRPIWVMGEERDDFGRLLVYMAVESAEGDLDVAAELLWDGFVLARGEHPRSERYEQLEERAREESTGLWSRDACGEPVDASVVIVDLESNAPGSDVENPNGEWIEVRNEGQREVDLSGWSIRDESTRHRYRFGAVVLAAGATLRVHSGCGTDDRGSLHWCDPDGPVWNNGGDTAFLLDPAGNPVDTWAYSGD